MLKVKWALKTRKASSPQIGTHVYQPPRFYRPSWSNAVRAGRKGHVCNECGCSGQWLRVYCFVLIQNQAGRWPEGSHLSDGDASQIWFYRMMQTWQPSAMTSSNGSPKPLYLRPVGLWNEKILTGPSKARVGLRFRARRQALNLLQKMDIFIQRNYMLLYKEWSSTKQYMDVLLPVGICFCWLCC